MFTIEVTFRDPGSSSETKDELRSKIEQKFTEMGWILDGIQIRSKPRRQGQEASVEEKEQTLHSTQRKCPKCGKLWGKRMFNRHDCNPQTVPDELNSARCSNQPITEQTSGLVSKTPGPQPSTNECQKSVQHPNMTYTHVELETSTTEISEKLKIYEERLRAIEEMLVCSICWEVVQRPHTLVCGHTYCTHCIWKWEQRQKHVGREPWCPQCLICFNSTRLLLDNSRGTKSEVKPYPQNVMLGQVTQVVFSDKLSTSEEPGGDSRFKVLDGDQAASSSSGVIDDEIEETESILGPLLGSIVFLYVCMSIFTYMFSSWQRPGTSPSK